MVSVRIGYVRGMKRCVGRERVRCLVSELIQVAREKEEDRLYLTHRRVVRGQRKNLVVVVVEVVESKEGRDRIENELDCGLIEVEGERGMFLYSSRRWISIRC